MSSGLVDQNSPIKLSRQERKQRTRQRLIDAVISIVCEEGVEALTTTRLTQYAQITQPGFYVHFKNIDHCLSVAAERIHERLIQLQAEARKSAYYKIKGLNDFDRTEIISLSIAEMITAVLSEPRLLEIFIRYRHDRSPLGEAMRKVTEHLRLAIAEDALRLAKGSEVPERFYPRFSAAAEVLTSVFIGALEACVAQRFNDNPLMTDIISRFIKNAMLGEVAFACGA
ncbi:MAG: TetR/AcrR family transcriptional regulator [Deltaproteobacteria bacterium]|nr:TetR/AcrR family transcriptional regulator [Deltaproteobacteria bacterium]